MCRLPWGQERIQNLVDPGGAALTNTWTYYSGTNDGGNYRLLKQEIDANGHWSYHQYDQNGRETNTVTQFLNTALSTATNAPASNRVVTTLYSTDGLQITTIEQLLGVEIGRGYKFVGSGSVQDIRCQTRGAASRADTDDF